MEHIKSYTGMLNFRDEIFSPNTSCLIVNGTNTHLGFLVVYEGIPQTLILNICGWLILITLFTILRKNAWNYGRIALVQKNENHYRWTQLFYGSVDEVAGISDNDSGSLSSIDSSIHIDKGYCSWISAIFRLRKEEILHKCGPDAIQYLSFQKHIILLMCIIMVISISVVLPINFQGELEGDVQSFGHTTVSNLDPNSPYLWIHVTLAILYLPLAIFLMRRFSVKAKIQEVELSSTKTLMITNIPRGACDSVDLRRHFREAYPDTTVQDIQLAFDITRVSKLDQEREKMYQAKMYCENYLRRTRLRLDMRPYACGNICVCCDMLGCAKVDAIDFYTREEERLIEEVDMERTRALRRPLGICFVTFTNPQDAKGVLQDLRHPCTLCGGCMENPSASTLSQQLRPQQWIAAMAPARSDIFWEHLSVPTQHWYLRALVINLVLFIVLFFLTTPAFVVNAFFTLPVAGKIEDTLNPVLYQFLPTLALWTVAALLPVLVSYSDQWLSHWTRSEQNHSIMRKTFSFLLFMVIILPSIGLTSADAFLRWTFHWSGDEKYRWECLFLPDKGAIFVNYVITSAFIGTGLELIRFPELFMYTIRLCLARSEAETVNVRRTILWEFPFGVQYAWMLLIFAMTTIYSLSCPLITVFGVVYMLMKHTVDKYNLYFAYGASKISPQIHESAINIVMLSVVLLQASFLALSVLRLGFNSIAIFSFIGLCLTVLFFVFNVFFSICKGFSPISYQRKTHTRSSSGSVHQESPRHRFVPDVLEPTPVDQPYVGHVADQSAGSASHPSYGTDGDGADFLTTNRRLYQHLKEVDNFTGA